MDAEQIRAWVRDLGNAKFLTRERAYQELRNSRVPLPSTNSPAHWPRNPATKSAAGASSCSTGFPWSSDEAIRKAAAAALQKAAAARSTSVARQAQAQLTRVAVVREREAASKLSKLGLQLSHLGSRVLSIEFNENWTGRACRSRALAVAHQRRVCPYRNQAR